MRHDPINHDGAGLRIRTNDMSLRELVQETWKHSWKLIVLVVGLLVILVGLAMIVLRGPALVVIPMGLLILSTEFEWARKILRNLRSHFRYWRMKIGSRRRRSVWEKMDPK